MKSFFLSLLLFIAGLTISFAQVGINTDGSVPDPSAMLDVKSTKMGMLVPRMTTAERDAINNPATGLLIFCSTNNQYYSNKGTPAAPIWTMVSSQWITNGTHIYYSGGKVGIGITDPVHELHVAGTIVAQFGTEVTAAYRFGDGLENTGLSSPETNTLAFITSGVQRVFLDQPGRLLIGAGIPASSAQLEVSSTTRGFLPPRMTTSQMNAIASPEAGLIIFNTSVSTLFWYNGTAWKTMSMNNDGESCGTVTYDGQTYNTVVIGTQCWMKENLNIGIAIIGATNQTNNGTIEKYCYDNLPSNCITYGGLYQWNEMMQYVTTSGAQGICPAGWHIPSSTEWNDMMTYLGGSSTAGGKMKETGTSHWSAPNTGATNSSGFTALPGGTRQDSGGAFSEMFTHGIFWTSSQSSISNARYQMLYFDDDDVGSHTLSKSFGFSCRCLKN